MAVEVNGDGGRGHSIVAIVLAVGIATAINVITAAVLYDAIFSQGPGLSENATQILTTAFSGMIGVLGSYIGYRAGAANAGAANAARPADPIERDIQAEIREHGDGPL